MWVERIFKFDEDIDFMYKLHDEEVSVNQLLEMKGKIVEVDLSDEHPDEDEPINRPDDIYDIRYKGNKYWTYGEYLHKQEVKVML